MANGPITATTWDSSNIVKQIHINEINAAITKLNTYVTNVDNCGNCDPSNCCQSCQTTTCQSSSCQSYSCQSCQSCQTCQTQTCQTQTCQACEIQLQCSNCTQCLGQCTVCDCSRSH